MRRAKSTKKTIPPADDASPAAVDESSIYSDEALRPDDQIAISNLSLHELFEQQARAILDRSDLDEEQRQNILVALSCPCCGGGAFSYTAKIRRRS